MNNASKKATMEVYLEKNVNMLPAGKYFIGDPVYFLKDSLSGNINGHYSLPDGSGFILHTISKNAVIASDKTTYTVESGSFGIISVDLGDYNKCTGDGSFHTFPNPVSLICEKDSLILKSGNKTVEFEQFEEYLYEDDGYDSCG